MKIGPKANAIDDIGKVDTSNMKIKVNGKDITKQKRYAIVRVKYDVCPIKYMIPKSYKNRCILHNKNCEQCGRTGDTKEQLIRKVAQVILKAWIDDKLKPNIETPFEVDIAKEIVEFLGVEDDKRK